jgi:hypothetical protein
MTLGNIRTNGVRSLAVSCLICHHKAVLAVDETVRPSLTGGQWR